MRTFTPTLCWALSGRRFFDPARFTAGCGLLILLAAQSSCSSEADTASESTSSDPTNSSNTVGAGNTATTSAATAGGVTTAGSSGQADSSNDSGDTSSSSSSNSSTGGIGTSTGGSGGDGGTGGASTTSPGTTTTATATTGAAGGGSIDVEPLDCGPDGWVVENHGPPSNRVNYIILADGYDATTVDTDLEAHIGVVMDRRFNHESGEPYGRYRKFVNICVMKVISETNGIGNGPTAFDGGNGGDRLAAVDSTKVNTYLDANLPEAIEADWRAVVLNQNLWENTGSALMLWSGAHAEAPGAALHEGGHGFHQLADEYCATDTGEGCGPNTEGSGQAGEEHGEINSTGNPEDTAGKWDRWLGVTQVGLRGGEATGVQGTFQGSRYVDSAQYRPSSNSMMNSLFGLEPNTSFNGISREQMIYSIWRHVVPIDATEPPSGAVTGTPVIQVFVIDPAVIDVDWSVDGSLVAPKGGTAFDVANAGLAPGTHTISATAYDNATEDLVKYRDAECPDSVESWYCHSTGWANATQTVEWTVSIP